MPGVKRVTAPGPLVESEDRLSVPAPMKRAGSSTDTLHNSRPSTPNSQRSGWQSVQDDSCKCCSDYVPMFLYNTIGALRFTGALSGGAGRPIIWLAAGLLSVVFVLMIGHYHLQNKAGPTASHIKMHKYLHWLGENLQSMYNESHVQQYTNQCFNSSDPSGRLMDTWIEQGMVGVSMYMNNGMQCHSNEKCGDVWDASNPNTVVAYLPGIVEPDYYVLVSMDIGTDNSSKIGYLLEISRALQSLIRNTEWIPARTVMFVAWGSTNASDWIANYNQIVASRIVAYVHISAQDDSSFTLTSSSLSRILYSATTSAQEFSFGRLRVDETTLLESCGMPYTFGAVKKPTLDRDSLDVIETMNSHGIPYVLLKNVEQQGRLAMEVVRKLIDAVVLPMGVIETVRCVHLELERRGIFSGSPMDHLLSLIPLVQHFQLIMQENWEEAIEIRLLNAHQINGRSLGFLKCFKTNPYCPRPRDALMVLKRRGQFSHQFSDIHLREAIQCAKTVLAQFP